jgi:hypothetical protein
MLVYWMVFSISGLLQLWFPFYVLQELRVILLTTMLYSKVNLNKAVTLAVFRGEKPIIEDVIAYLSDVTRQGLKLIR